MTFSENTNRLKSLLRLAWQSNKNPFGQEVRQFSKLLQNIYFFPYIFQEIHRDFE